MNLSRLLFKPKWQDKNPEVRRAAIASGNDADMIAALPQLARNDSDASVRLAALKRFNDYEAWRERSTGDTEARCELCVVCHGSSFSLSPEGRGQG